MFNVGYLNILTLIKIVIIKYIVEDVILFIGYGTDTTQQLMAYIVGCIIAIRNLGSPIYERFANQFGEENPLYAMGFMREKSQHSKWAAYQTGIFFWQVITLIIAIMSKIVFILLQRFAFSNIVMYTYMGKFIRITGVLYIVTIIGYIITRIYYEIIYHRSFRYYAGGDKVWKPFSFIGQDYYYCSEWPEELKVIPRNNASTYPYEENDNVKENIKKTCVSDGYEKESEFEFSEQGKVAFYKKTAASEVHILSIAETEVLKDDHTKQLNDFFGEFWKDNLKEEEKKQPIYFTFIIFCRKPKSLLAKQILEEERGMIVCKDRYRLGAIYNEKRCDLNIKQVSQKSHYKDTYRKMSRELRAFAGGYTEM